MYIFYIFKIKKEIMILTKDIPYYMYHMISNLKNEDYLNYKIKECDEIFNYFNVNYLNHKINLELQGNKYYNYNGKVHMINNKYSLEHSYLKVYPEYILIKSNILHPSLLIKYLSTNNLFVCDFKNKNYYWLNRFVR